MDSTQSSQHLFADTKKGLKALLTEVHISLDMRSEDPPILAQEQALVVRNMLKYFSGEEGTTRLANFIKTMKTICKKEKYCKKFLQPTLLKKTNDTSVNIYQDSFFRILLKLPCLQSDIISILLDGLTLVAMEETQDTSWLRHLLKPLRYLPDVRNSADLTKKLLDILEISTFSCQLELLDAIPQIIPDNDCAQAAKQLIPLLDDNDELSGAIIDCLNALNLESDVRAQVQDRILAKLLAGASPKLFPIFLQFLLSDSKSPNLVTTLYKIRNALQNIMSSTGSSNEVESSKILTFHHLQMFTMSQKAVSEAWLTTISNIKSHNDHKPIDFLIMFMLHYITETKKRLIEGIFRKRVTMGLFKIELLQKVFERYMPQQLLKDYIHTIIEIGCCLLRASKDAAVSKFAVTLFEILFNHPYIGTVYRGDVISNLISLTASSDSSVVNTNLNLLFSLASIDKKKLQQHTSLLMQLLEKLDTLELKDVKIVFDILCSLTCGENYNDLSGFKNEIHITVRKLLSSSERTVKHRGIVSALVMVKHLASIELDNESDSSIDESLTSSNFPEGCPKEAANLVELTYNCTGSCPELLGLYYDQLASMLASSHFFDKYFLYWLYNMATEDFQALFVTDVVPESLKDFNFSMQYVISGESEDCFPLGIDIASYTIWKKSDKILLLAPFFRVLRLLHSRQHNEKLATLDGMLGCGIILPDVDDPESLDFEGIKQTVDCLFHCAGWIREIISAFVTQKEQSVQTKVVRRLQNLIDIEKKMYLFLGYVPGHNLPISYFDSLMNVSKQTVKSEAHSSKNSRKKIKSTSVVNEGNETTLNSQKNSKQGSVKLKNVHRNVKFREIDTDVVRLMKYPLQLHDEDMSQSSNALFLNLDQVKFLLKDFVSKLSVLMQTKNIGLSHLNDVQPEHLIQDCVHIFPYIDKYLLAIVEHLKTYLAKTDARHDLPDLYTNEASDIKLCFGYILRIFYLVFKWPGFQNVSNVDLLRNLFKSMKPESSQTLLSLNRLVTEFILRIGSYTEECLHLNHAVDLIQTMEVLYNVVAPNEDLKKKIAIAAEVLLNKRWYNAIGGLDHGKECNENINVLVKASLSTFTVKKICGLVGTIKEQVEHLQQKDDCLSALVAIDKQNFHVFYLGLCNALLDAVKNEIQSLTNNEHLILWLTVAHTMEGLKTIVNTLENRTNQVCFLKKSIAILKVFLSHGIPILEIMLKSKPSEVCQIFRGLQDSTRFLHKLCCESKLTQDARVVSYIPTFRHILEALVYRVKAALIVNDCSAAFWMGPLKNRNLQGDDIISQSTVVSTEADDTRNDDLRSDDEVVDEDESIIADDNVNNGHESNESEVYN